MRFRLNQFTSLMLRSNLAAGINPHYQTRNVMIITKAPFQASILATAILLTACGGDSKSSNNEVISQVGFSSQTEGNATISAIGGNSASREGGNGGDIEITQSNSPAALNIQTAGIADTSYQLPETNVNLGSLAVTITEDTEVETVDRITSNTPSGTIYMAEGKNRLYQYDGESDFEARNNEITGLVIEAGITLTLEAESDYNIELLFANDLVNNGTISTYVSNTEWNARNKRTSISLYPAAYSGSGDIITDGEHAGQGAGDISISAYTLNNSGKLSAIGADGEDGSDVNGGQGGSISLFTSTFLENTGNINTSGGEALNGLAGLAGSVSLRADEVYNSGLITAIANEGENNSDQDSTQKIEIIAEEVLINIANLSVNGADALEDGYATDAGNIHLYLISGSATKSNNRRLINTGNLTANGGNTATTETSQEAGQGGDIIIYATGNDDSNVASESLVIISGNLSANGGDSSQNYVEDEQDQSITQGSDAGDAGNIYITHQSHSAHALPTYLAGYKNLIVDGGNGLQAGNAGDVSINNYTGSLIEKPLAGPMVVETDISANAGTSIPSASESAARGGNGGGVELIITHAQPFLQPGALKIQLAGNISANAGDVNNGIPGSTSKVLVKAAHGVTISGDISINGGSDTEQEDEDDLYNQGKDAGSVGFSSLEGNVNYSGTISANGGDGIERAGNAGSFYSLASMANAVAGSISLNGGNATPDEITTFDTVGGDAGVALVQSDDFIATFTASLSAVPGTGDEPGREGGVRVNADCQQGTCNDKDENLVY